jgi:hypothetical protein
MAWMPELANARKRSALGATLAVMTCALALFAPGAGVASADPSPPMSFFALSPGASLPASVPCGTVAEFTAPHGFEFPVQQSGRLLAAFGLPPAQASSIIAQFRLLGTFFSTLAIPAPSCAPGGTVEE